MKTSDARLSIEIASLDADLVSVVMPSFNAASTIRASVECVLGQSYPHIELIVVDDGSTDGTLGIVEEIVARDPARIRLFRQSHKGPYPARNLGLSHAKGGYVAFLDADDTWTPDCIERLHGALLSHSADIAYCGWQNVGAAAPGTEPYIPPAYEEGDPIAACLRTCPWPIHAALTRTSAIAAVDGFSERMFTAMDYDLWIRLIAHTRRIVRVPEVMAFYHWRGNQISSDRSRQILDAIAVRRDFITANPALVAHLTPLQLRRFVDGYLMDRAYQAFWHRDLRTAQRLFRAARNLHSWQARDLPYVLMATLPEKIFNRLVRYRDYLSNKIG